MINAYNATPENFGVPADEVIDEVIRLVDTQMEIDSRVEKPLSSSSGSLLGQSPNWSTPQVDKAVFDYNEQKKEAAMDSSSLSLTMSEEQKEKFSSANVSDDHF